MNKRRKLVELQTKHPAVQVELKYGNDSSSAAPAPSTGAKGKPSAVPATVAATVRLTGFRMAVDAAKKDVLDIQKSATHVELDISGDPKILPVLLSTRPVVTTAEDGTQNEVDPADTRPSALKVIEEDCGVNINLSRESMLIEVKGLRDGVNEACRRLREIIFANKEVEEEMVIERYLWLSCMLGKGGQTLRILSKFLNVRISVPEDSGKKGEATVGMKIKGTYGKVTAAITHIKAIIEQYLAESACIDIQDDYLIPIVLGKAGAGIKAIRERFPNADIDIEGNQKGACKIYIHSQSPETVKVVKAHIESILEQNFEAELTLSEDCAIQLKSQKGAETRAKVLQELGLFMNIDKSNQSLRLRGPRAQVSVGLAVIQGFCESFRVEKIHYQEEDYLTLSHTSKAADGKEEGQSIIKKIEAAFEVEISANRKEQYLRVQGSPAAVTAAMKAIEQFISGAENSGSILVSIGPSDSVFAALIGKSGANIKRIEDEFQVKCDLIKSKRVFRMCGEPANLKSAKVHVLNFIDTLKVTETLSEETATVSLLKAEIDALLRLTGDIFNVEIKSSAASAPGTFSVELKGSNYFVQEAKSFLSNRLSGQDKRRLPLPSLKSHDTLLQGFSTRKTGAVSLTQIRASYPAVEIKMIEVDAHLYLEIRGEAGAASKATAELLHLFETLLPPGFLALKTCSAVFLRDVMTSQFLSELMDTGAAVVHDRLVSHVYFAGEPSTIEAAQGIFQTKFEEWKALNAEVAIEEFMLPIIVGKNGSNIAAWTEETKASLQVNKRLMRVEIKGATAESTEAARRSIEEKVEQLRKQHWELSVSLEFVGVVIGKQGAVINKIRAESGAHVDVDAAQKLVKVHSPLYRPRR